MRQLFIQTVAGLETGNAAVDILDSGNEGKILFVDVDGNNIDLAADTISKPFYIAQGQGAEGRVLKSNLIQPKQVIEHNVNLASQGKKQITSIGDTGETAIDNALPTDSDITLKVIRTDLGYGPDPVEIYEISASADPAGDLKALIDEQSEIVTATKVAATNLDITGLTVDIGFQTVITDGAGNKLDSTFAVTQTPQRNVGNLNFLRNIEEYAEASEGYFNRIYKPQSPQSRVVDIADLSVDLNAGNLANGYDVVTIKIDTANGASIGPKYTEIYLGYPADYATPADSVLAAGNADFDTLFA